jgi:FixJ family two-component response regulator
MSGIDLQRRLRAEGSTLPIVMITGSRAEIVREYAERSGCFAFLLKPFSGETMLGVLATLATEFPT